MKNRDKLRNRALYDLMVTINRSRHKLCPIEIVGERKPKCLPSIYGLAQTDCEKCIQRWLNEERKCEHETNSTKT
jgi:hypothetical protein